MQRRAAGFDDCFISRDIFDISYVCASMIATCRMGKARDGFIFISRFRFSGYMGVRLYEADHDGTGHFSLLH